MDNTSFWGFGNDANFFKRSPNIHRNHNTTNVPRTYPHTNHIVTYCHSHSQLNQHSEQQPTYATKSIRPTTRPTTNWGTHAYRASYHADIQTTLHSKVIDIDELLLTTNEAAVPERTNYYVLPLPVVPSFGLYILSSSTVRNSAMKCVVIVCHSNRKVSTSCLTIASRFVVRDFVFKLDNWTVSKCVHDGWSAGG